MIGGAQPCDITAGVGPVVPGNQDAGSQPAPIASATHSVRCAVTADRYKAIDELGRGGWGVVERAIDHQLNREVAVKRMAPQLSARHDLRDQFLHEAKITSKLQHPGIVPVHELGSSHGGEDFYVMKLLQGRSLAAHIRDAHQPTCAKHPNSRQLRAIYLPLLDRFIDVCQAVAYAHRCGVVHRDLKPANVMVAAFGETIVVDWGLAIDLTAAADPNESTRLACDAVVGTPAYMSPEQAAGRTGDLSPAWDIYSLGVLLFEIVCGTTPHSDCDQATKLSRARSGDMPGLRDRQPAAPAALAAICAKAMASDASQRYDGAEPLADDVRRFIAGDTVSVYRDRWSERALRWCRHHPTATGVLTTSAAGLLAASLAFTAIVHNAHRIERQARQDAEAAHREAYLENIQLKHALETIERFPRS